MNQPDDLRPLDDALRAKLDAYRPEPSEAVWAAIEARVGAAPPPAAPRRWAGAAFWPALLTGVLGVALGWWLPHPSNVTPAQQNETVVTRTGPTVGAVTDGSVTDGATTAPSSAASEGTAVAVASSAKPDEIYKTSGSYTPRQTTIKKAVSTKNQLAYQAQTFTTPALPLVLLPLLTAETAVQATTPPAVALTDTAARTAARAARHLALTAEKRALAHLQRRADSLLTLLAFGTEGPVLAVAPPVAAPATSEETPSPTDHAVVVRRPPALAHRWRLMATLTPEHATLAATGGPETARFGARSARSAALSAGYLLTESLTLSAGVGYGQLDAARGGHPAVAYHFLTVPVAVQYRLTPLSRSTRCWADVGAGAQVQAQVGRAAGETRFGGPPVAFTAALGLNLALAPRLVVRLAPTARWQPRRLTATGVAVAVGLTL